jgi:signal transduction histidine kinase
MMAWQFTPYALPMIIAGTLAAAMIVLAWRRRASAGAPAFALLTTALTVWSFGYALELSSLTLTGVYRVAVLQYFGIVAVPPAWLVIGLQFDRRDRALRPRTVALLALSPVATLLLVVTNQYHGLIWRDYELAQHDGFALLSVTYGPWFWVHTAYSYLCLVVGSVLLARTLRSTQHLYQAQIAALLVSVILPSAANVIYLARLGPWPELDLTPFAFSVSSFVLMWSLFSMRLFDIVPVAHDTVVNSLSDGVIVIDAKSRVVEINASAERMLHQPAVTAIGAPITALLARWPEVVERYCDVMEAAEEVVVGENDVLRTFELRITPLYDRRGRLAGRVCVWRDISAQKHIQAALAEAKDTAESATRAKSMFLANMSHELRTPLTAILGYCQLLQLELRDLDRPVVTADLEAIETSGSHLLALINNVLDFAKIEANRTSLQLESFDVAILMHDVAGAFRSLLQHKAVHLRVECDDHIGAIYADKVKVRQILFNLLSNAARVTQEGHITITAMHEEQSGRPWIVLEVIDTGAGMAPEVVHRLFSESAQAFGADQPSSGAGLGLTICRHFCDLMGGNISVESTPGQGSTFRVRLPAQRAPSTTVARVTQVS